MRICKGPGHGHSHGPPKTKKETKSNDKKKEKSKEDENAKKEKSDQQGEMDEDQKGTAEKKKPSKTALKGSPRSIKDNETKEISKCPDSPSGKRVRFTGVDKIVSLPTGPGMQSQTQTHKTLFIANKIIPFKSNQRKRLALIFDLTFQFPMHEGRFFFSGFVLS